MKRILVIGECCTDEFVYGEVNRLSPEAPVPILKPIEMVSNLGMAGNVSKNIAALDPECEIILQHQDELIVKRRFVENKSNHMFLRVDEGENNIKPLEWGYYMDSFIAQADAVVVSDYNKGYLTAAHLKEIARKSKLSILDSKRDLTDDIVKDFTFIKLNESERNRNLHLSHRGIITTIGSKGAIYDGELIPQENPQQTIDVSGAGDTFVAAFILSFLDNLEVIPSIEFANEMAGEVVSKRGVVTPNKNGKVHTSI